MVCPCLRFGLQFAGRAACFLAAGPAQPTVNGPPVHAMALGKDFELRPLPMRSVPVLLPQCPDLPVGHLGREVVISPVILALRQTIMHVLLLCPQLEMARVAAARITASRTQMPNNKSTVDTRQG